ncbi:MAG: UDP-glucose 4-epimerase GalE [Burkholderiales bacterium]|nr:UDP-glucose 4-epimerase GalE [Burkholderiales bacterium]
MKVLVVGGAGYIGSHMVLMLLDRGHEPVVFDNLSSGSRESVLGGTFIEGDLGDASALEALFAAHRFDGVMHFASFIQVGESMREPAKYYRNNLANTLNLLEAMQRHGTNHCIFSSTAAIFGEPEYVPIDEHHPRRPINPYGFSKYAVEHVLSDFDRAYAMRSICLRYFNAAGADPQARIGECHDPETHLIPLVLQAASGQRRHIDVFGQDYDTPDGTCVRDYIHILDLCEAHLLALDRLARGAPSAAYNLGNGNGFSVNEVIDAAERVAGTPIARAHAARRPGDPARLVADSTLARTELGWRPRFDDLETIVRHAWAWERRQVLERGTRG